MNAKLACVALSTHARASFVSKGFEKLTSNSFGGRVLLYQSVRMN